MRHRTPLIIGILVVAGWAAVLDSQPRRPSSREIVAAYTKAFDAHREQDWRDSVARAAQLDPAQQALADGTAARLAFHFREADSAYARVEALAPHPAVAYAYLGRAALLAARGGLGDARAALETAATMLRNAHDSLGAAEAIANLALIELRVTGVSAARAHLTAARAWSPLSDSILPSRLACAQLQVDVRAGTRIADSTWATQRILALASGPRAVAECGFVHAQYLSSQGRASQAIAMFDTVAVAQTQIRAWNALSATRQWQGTELLGRGLHTAAHRHLTEALALAERSGSANASAWALLQLARLAQRTGALGDAATLAQRARPLFVASGDRTGQLFSDHASAESALLAGDFAGADSLLVRLTREFAVINPIGLPTVVAARAWMVGRTNPERAQVLLDSVSLLAEQRNLPGWTSDLLYHRALLSLRTGHPADALPRLDSLLARRIQGPARFETMERRAEAFAALGLHDDAWVAYGDAIRELERWRRTVPNRGQQLSSLQDRGYDWDRDLDLATLISRTARVDRIPEALAMAEARRVRGREQESLQRSALALDVGPENPSSGESTTSARIVVQVRDALQLDPARLPALAASRLSPTDAILSYVTGTDGEATTLFVLTTAHVQAWTLPPLDSLIADLRTFSGLLAAGRRSATLAASLSTALLTPALAQLPVGVTRLRIVADGELHRVPFAALNAPNGDVLINRYALAQALSVEDALGGVRRGVRVPGTRIVAVGAPATMSDVNGQRLPALAGAQREVRMVANALDGVQLLTGRQATRQALLQAGRAGGQLLHVATHAIADQRSYMGSAVALQPTATDDGILRLGDVQQLALPFDLVVLSACSSGDGVLLAGQGLHGFVGATLDAGAGGVIATYWALGDTAIVPWIAKLYEELLRDGDPVRALQATQRTAIAAGQSPAVWANLHYVGDPDVRVPLQRRTHSIWSRLSHLAQRVFGAG